MPTDRMTIDNHEYLLDPGVDVEALQLEICTAFRNGGGIVSFQTRTRSMTAVLSPGVPVFFERLESVEHGDAALPIGPDDYFVIDDYDG